jgi:hypothetical protein
MDWRVREVNQVNKMTQSCKSHFLMRLHDIFEMEIENHFVERTIHVMLCFFEWRIPITLVACHIHRRFANLAKWDWTISSHSHMTQLIFIMTLNSESIRKLFNLAIYPYKRMKSLPVGFPSAASPPSTSSIDRLINQPAARSSTILFHHPRLQQARAEKVHHTHPWQEMTIWTLIFDCPFSPDQIRAIPTPIIDDLLYQRRCLNIPSLLLTTPTTVPSLQSTSQSGMTSYALHSSLKPVAFAIPFVSVMTVTNY